MVVATETSSHPNGTLANGSSHVNGAQGASGPSKAKLSKNQLRRAKAKQKKGASTNGTDKENDQEGADADDEKEQEEAEPVTQTSAKTTEELAREFNVNDGDLPDGFGDIFKKFQLPAEDSRVRPFSTFSFIFCRSSYLPS
jgi:hypothetical protein